MGEKNAQTEQSKTRDWGYNFKSLVDSGHITFAVTDATGKLTFFNKALSLSTGLRADEITGRSFLDFVHPDDKVRVMDMFHKAFVSPQGYTQLGVRILGKQGVVRHMIASANSIREQGEIVGFNALLTDITELKLAENALEVSEKKFRNLVENAPIGIGITTLEGKPVYRNTAMVELYGYSSKEELMQEHMVARYHDPEDRERFIQEAQRGTIRDFEVKLKRKNGTDFWGSLTAIPQMTECGPGYFTIIQDISKRKKWEEELKLRAALLDVAKDVIVLRNFDEGPDAKFLYVNEAACKLYGYTRDELLNMNMENLAVIDNRERVKELVANRRTRLVEVGRVTHEWVHRKKDGTRIPIEHQSSVSTLNGKRYILNIIRDISERKKTEEALVTSEHKFRSLFMALHEGAALSEIIYDDSGKAVDYRITDINQEFESIVGLKRDDVIGMQGSELHGAYNPPFLETYADVAQSGKSASFQAHFDSLEKDYIVSVSSYRKGVFLTVFFDITSSKRANEQILTYQKELQSLASQLSLAEERSRRAIAIGVHDRFGQGLALCSMKLDELAQSSTTPQKDRLSEVRDMIKEMVKEVRSLTFELSSPLLYEVGLEAAIERLTEQTQENYHINCTFKDDGKSKQLHSNVRILLFQAVRELLFNVTKHAQALNIAVNIRRYRNQMWIKVEDDGIGFDTSLLESNKLTRKGFGLFSIRERLHYIGGEVDFVSQPGRGTRVILKAPLEKQHSIGKTT